MSKEFVHSRHKPVPVVDLPDDPSVVVSVLIELNWIFMSRLREITHKIERVHNYLAKFVLFLPKSMIS